MLRFINAAAAASAGSRIVPPLSDHYPHILRLSASQTPQNLGASLGTWALSKTGKKSAGDATGFTGFCERIVSGDVIGCEADLTEGTIRFWKNGVHLGVAFTGLENRGLTLVPAICIGSNSGGKTAEVTFVEWMEVVVGAAPIPP